MKKLFQISLMLVVTIVLMAGAIQLAADSWMDVGWNSGVSASAPQGERFAACTLYGFIADPDVGWNS
jgi:hypothetical protein